MCGSHGPVIRAGLVEAKLDELNEKLIVSRSTHNEFGMAQWLELQVFSLCTLICFLFCICLGNIFVNTTYHVLHRHHGYNPALNNHSMVAEHPMMFNPAILITHTGHILTSRKSSRAGTPIWARCSRFLTASAASSRPSPHKLSNYLYIIYNMYYFQ